MPVEQQSLAAAAANSDWASLKRFLARGDNPNPTSRVGAAPTHFVAAAGRAEELELLIAAGARPDAVDETGWSPLFWAANNGHLSCVALLVNRGAEPDRS